MRMCCLNIFSPRNALDIPPNENTILFRRLRTKMRTTKWPIAETLPCLFFLLLDCAYFQSIVLRHKIIPAPPPTNHLPLLAPSDTSMETSAPALPYFPQ